MRKLIRIATGMLVTSAFVFVAPTVALADHGTATPDPNLGDNNPTGGVHEPPPLPAIANPEVPCLVQGEVSPGSSGNSQPHLVPPVGNNATHSHYSFIGATIVCTDFPGLVPGFQTVTSTGGNDGHCIDVDTQSVAGCLNVHPLGAAESHHGSTNDSAWSSSSGFSGGSGGGQSNSCANGANTNKGDIEVAALGSSGWVKYLRIGVALYVWGCFTNDGGLGEPNFSAALAVYPPSPSGATTLPFCLIAPDFPVIGPIVGSPTGCGFSITGVAYRGDGWALDLEA